MNDDQAVATKQDIQMLLDAINTIGQDSDQRFSDMDQRFKKLEDRIEESELHTRILIEDLEGRVFGANTDQFSVHTDKLENHEVRITDIEAQPVYA